ncbi:hypothetical protein ACGF1Z_00280 [Streptomyces sp. NPDC048018]|uniref:hypothetical protein n=1 Tax=Streptomyces sp. NPDC048018 TaxID=3365499 RepID=UPI00371FD599
MPKHRRTARPAAEHQARHRTAAGLVITGALAATLLTATGRPAAPPAPDRQATTSLNTASVPDN